MCYIVSSQYKWLNPSHLDFNWPHIIVSAPFCVLMILYRADCVNATSTCALSNNERLGIYGGLVGTTLFTATLRTVTFFVLAINASRVLHNRMFSSVLRSPVLFFDTNPIGEQLTNNNYYILL